MRSPDIYESLLQEVCGLDRAAVIERLSRFPGDLRLDFSLDYLQGCNTEHLRHLLLAALWRCHTKKQSPVPNA